MAQMPAATRQPKPKTEPKEDFFEGPPAATAAPKQISPTRFEDPPPEVGHRVVIHGRGGVGKSSLADLAPGPVVSFDLDGSLGVLQPPHTQRVVGIETWDDLLKGLKDLGAWEKVKTLVVDSGTKAEELALKWTLTNVPANSTGGHATSIEGYGYGKGYTYLADTWGQLLAALDAHAEAGRNVILICHSCTQMVPNPHGEDAMRYEPRLQAPSGGKASNRLRTLEWADHMLFMDFDTAVNKENKAQAGGTRTLYYTETGWAMAKNRMGLTGSDPVVAGSDAIWRKVFGLDAKEEK